MAHSLHSFLVIANDGSDTPCTTYEYSATCGFSVVAALSAGGTSGAITGTEGLFAALESRGNVYSGFAGAAAPGSGALGDFDEILQQLDKQGAIEENMLFLSSFNHINDIFSLTQQTGVAYWGVEENNIGHNMRSIIIDRNLKLVRTFDGIDWKPGDAKNAIENLIKVYK